MSKIIEAARTHYRSQLSGGLQKLHVEEWDTDVYYTNNINYKDQSRLIDLHASGKTSDALIESLIVKCRTEKGEPLFTNADRQVLLHEADPNVILKIVTGMNAPKATPEDIEKN